ncbi:thr operon leader peptide [Kluyvera ascorbata]|uniref:thr operon leader peptide n=1 Tax=Kluyvera ascorbata TaxID=51288 RepID=A0A3N2S0W7_9ENTR|nr:thr operon leader peptide [Kluyvera ascorbata]HEB4874214.1 thr operon leader peptide [Kluyvera ascorbata F0526]ROU13402.1 thr operon leader peptide [Kluyvera ascorbata]HAT7515826.1 thr operon leader peptide [Kluyvera ascorbata]HBL0731984.1 thr operon leader peptide [Kluyvera ascorbata]
MDRYFNQYRYTDREITEHTTSMIRISSIMTITTTTITTGNGAG